MKIVQGWNWKEEIPNAITHGLGFALSIPALFLLIHNSLQSENHGRLGLASVIVFGVSMMLLYLCSTLHHSLPFAKTKRLFKVLDHSAIFVFIAGTYTPFLLVTLEGTLGWSLFGLMWFIALSGIVFKVFFVNRFSRLATLGYLLMGWMVVFAWGPLTENLAPEGVTIMIAGGLFYSVGTIFYLWKKLPGLRKIKLPFVHAIWHLFVMAGSFCMFLSILLFV